MVHIINSGYLFMKFILFFYNYQRICIFEIYNYNNFVFFTLNYLLFVAYFDKFGLSFAFN